MFPSYFSKCEECLLLTASDLEVHQGIQRYLRHKFRTSCDQMNQLRAQSFLTPEQVFELKKLMLEVTETELTLTNNERHSPERLMTKCFHHKSRDYATALRDFGPQNLFFL
jgi:hypothetical protein